MNLFGLAQRAHQAKVLLKDYSPAILTGIGVTGTITTAYLTGQASFKAARLIAEEEHAKLTGPYSDNTVLTKSSSDNLILTKSQKVKLVWKFYIPPVGVGATTIASIILANRVASTKIAALAAASSISERALQEYKEKIVEKIGEKQERNARDEIAQDRINKNPMPSREVILAGTGQVLCYDMHTGRYFVSTMEDIKRAENKINFELNHYMHASASEFYDEIGLPATTYTDNVGWNSDKPLEVVFSSTLTSDSKPCLAIDFKNPPTTEYNRFHN